MATAEPRRLPVLGADEAPDVAAERAPDASRIVPSFSLISVTAALPEAEAAARAQAAAFVCAAAALGVDTAVLSVARALHGSFERVAAADDDPFVRAGASSVRTLAVEASLAGDAVARALEGLAGSDLVVSLGADVLAFALPDFSILVDRGAPLLGYGAMARAVRDRCDARVEGAREAWAPRVVSAVLSNSRRRP